LGRAVRADTTVVPECRRRASPPFPAAKTDHSETLLVSDTFGRDYNIG